MTDSSINGSIAGVQNLALHQLAGYAELTKAASGSRSTIKEGLARTLGRR